jgi:hypothetical protein
MNTFELRDNLRYYNQRFSEMPVGDPMSGAAYGEYLKSKAIGAIIGVVAAVAAVWTGGATLAAYAAGTAGVSIGSAIAAGAMVAGGVMSGVGAVTGNKKLMKIGGVLALAGGLGSMAASAFSGTSSAVAEGSAAAQPVAEGSAAGASEQLVGKLGGTATSEAFGATAEGMNAAALDVSASAIPPVQNLGSGLQEAGGIVSQAGSAGPSMANIPTSSTGVLADATSAQAASAVNASPAAETGGFLEKAGGWMEKNKTLVEMGGKLLSNVSGQALNGGNPVGSGGGSGSPEGNEALQAAKTEQLNSVTEANRAKTAAEAQQRKNANTQVEMISATDPNRDAKVADAVARGAPYQIMFQPAAAPVTMSGQNYGASSNQWAPQR